MATAMKPELARTEILPLVLEMATDNVSLFPHVLKCTGRGVYLYVY